jgi:hypothetical protein
VNRSRSSAPGKNRTCDLRFRKTLENGADCGTASTSAEKSPPDSASTNVRAEPNGLGHQGGLGGATKSGDERGGLKEALADLIASLNARLGSDGYLLSVDVVEGELDLGGLEFPKETRGAVETTLRRGVSASEATSPTTSVAAPEAAGLEGKEPAGRRAPLRRRKRQADAGPGPADEQEDLGPRAETSAPTRRRGGRS